MKKRFLALSLALAMCLAMLTGCGGGNDAATDDGGSTDDAAPGTPEVTWVASCANADDHPAVQGVHKFAELVEEKSGGRMHIDVFANAQLASDRDCIEGMQMNTIQSGIMVSSALAGFTDELLVFDLPFLFENSAQGQAVCDSDVGQQILGTLEDIGIKGLGWMEYGMRNITNSVRPIEKPEDLQGIKIRTMENQNHMAFWSALGAAPTPLAWPEVYISLQNGTIDAQENAADTCMTSNFQEVQKYLNFTNHILYLNQIIINNDKFNSLDPLYQDALTQAVEEAIAELRPALTELDKSSKDTLAAGGMEMVEYAPEFYDEILNLQGVQDLYTKIDGEVDGLGTILQDELAAVAGA